MMLHRGWRLVVFILTLALGATAALAADTSQPKTPPRTVADITALLDQYQPDQARVAERKAVLAEPPPQTSDKKRSQNTGFDARLSRRSRDMGMK